MDNNTDTDTAWEKYLEKLSTLPPKLQNALILLINNYEVAVKICESSNLTDTERDQHMKKAIESDDSILEILLILDNILKHDLKK